MTSKGTLTAYRKKWLQDVNHFFQSKKKELTDEIISLKEEVAALAFDNSELHDTIQTILSSEPKITTFENSKYTDDVRACVYVENLTHQSIQRLPSYGITCKMMIESLAVVQALLGDCLSQANGFVKLQTDGTTKFGEHFTTYDVKTESLSYTLGLRHVFSGSSSDTFETLKEILSDIESVQLPLGA